jgi:hypothetical protein
MSKTGLPSDMAFPVAAGKLMEKLGNVPQKAEIDVSYLYYKPMTARRRQKTKGGSKPFRDSSRDIVVASFELKAVSLTTPNSWLEMEGGLNKYTKPKWSIILRPAPVKDLSLIREHMDCEGYHKIRNWLAEANKYAGSIGNHSLAVEFDGTRLNYHQHDYLY